jgi:phenylalanyl-tRNA synthetase alpha chain
VKQAIEEIKKQFEAELGIVASLKEIEELKLKYLGKKGLVQAQMQHLRNVPPEQKPEFGKIVNDLKVYVEGTIATSEGYFHEKEELAKLSQEVIDTSAPGRKKNLGSKHPVTAMIDEIVDIFISMWFSVVDAPEIETDYYNFEVLNFAPDHPARDMQDTFYIEPGVLLRTHATTFQGRLLESEKPPLRVICPGRVYRNETISTRSHVFFHQVDGMYIAEKVSFQDLISTMSEFIQKLFHKEVAVRFRPSYFPFVEPGCEVDVACLVCEGKGCPICKHSGWLEILGAGMIHPQVLRNCGLDPEKYTGYAWGLGVERLILLRYGITDIRLFAENDMRFLSQFPVL